jgi:phosphocarrier protein HPr
VSVQREVRVSNKLGLHARASAQLVNLASRYASSIRLELNGQSVDAKSIMGIMMLAATTGSLISVTADGADAEDAVKSIVDLFDQKFGEEE